MGTRTRNRANNIQADGTPTTLNESSVTAFASTFDDNKLQSNVALLGFKTAVNGSLAKYNLQDQIIDEFTDATGVDTSASTNEVLSSGTYFGGITGTVNNYYGDDSDGALTTSGNVTHTVQNKVGSYDGDMVVKQYSSLTIGSGHTMTTDQPCRGMLIYVSGNCSIAGTLTMNARGGDANPTSSTASSDGNVVNAAGLQMGLFTASAGSSTLTNAATNFNGFGTAVRTAFANQTNADSNGTIFTITRTGGAAVASVGSGNQDGGTGTAGTLSGTSMGAGSGGKGGIGSVSGVAADFPLGYSGAGGAFGGGSGATSVRYSGDPGTIADTVFGGQPPTPVTNGSRVASGGVGNPGGVGVNGGQAGTDGTGGILILIVGGTLTITGTVSANGNGNDTLTTNAAIGGSAGGGAVMILYKGTLSNSGTVQALGGPASTASAFGDGGAGGAGTTQIVQLDTASATTVGGDLTLQSTDTTASTEADNADMVMLMENSSGTATLNTDIKGYISRDSGTTFTQGTLVDEGTWGTNKKILAFHDLDISGQPSGTDMCYKITTHNQSAGSKETKIHATSIGWK